MIDYQVSEGLCVLRLHAPPVNALSRELLTGLRAAVRRANVDPEVNALVITGGSTHFSAGADLADFRAIKTPADATAMSRNFQEALQEVEDSAKPVVAAVAGHVLGGALELALACHFRIAAEGSRFSMPEVKLGINPGGGGTQRLPRLIGLAAALPLLLTGQSLGAPRARQLGLVDSVCSADFFLPCARQLLASTAPRPRTNRRQDRIQDALANAAALAQGEALANASRPEIIAPRTILTAVRKGVEESFEAGLGAEREGFSQCMATTATGNKFYVFLSSRQTSKIPEWEGISGPTISRAAVVGLGTMGTGIAQALIAAAIPVVAYDENPLALERGLNRIRTSLGGRVNQGKLSEIKAQEVLNLLSTTTDPQNMARADLVIESVFEDVVVKRATLRRLEEVCSPQTIIASNTSTISLDVLAEEMQNPERLLGMHFFNPAQRMPLVEVIYRPATPPGLAAAVLRFARRIGKTPVLVKNREGFLVSRLFVPYLKEAFWLLEEGADPVAIDRAMVEFGFAMGPLALIDMAGLDILAFTDKVLRAAFPRHDGPSLIVERLVQQGHLGQKTGSGVYRYEQGNRMPLPNPTTAQIIAEVQQGKGLRPCTVGDADITQRLILRMVNEAFYVLEEGLCQRPSDLDVAMVLGTGLADFRGGVVKYAKDLGLERVRARLLELAARHGERYAPPPQRERLSGTL